MQQTRHPCLNGLIQRLKWFPVVPSKFYIHKLEIRSTRTLNIAKSQGCFFLAGYKWSANQDQAGAEILLDMQSNTFGMIAEPSNALPECWKCAQIMSMHYPALLYCQGKNDVYEHGCWTHTKPLCFSSATPLNKHSQPLLAKGEAAALQQTLFTGAVKGIRDHAVKPLQDYTRHRLL